MVTELKARVDLATGPAQNALAQLSAQFKTLSANSNTTQTRLKSVATQMRAVSTAARDEAAALQKLATAQKTLMSAEDARRRSNANNGLTKARTAAVNSDSEGRRVLAESKTLTEEVRRRGMIEEQNARRVARAQKEVKDALREQERLARAVARAEEQRYEHLASTRYALYDIAGTATIAAAAMTALAVAPIAFAANWEAAFASVIRTTGVYQGQADEAAAKTKDLKQDFVELAQTIPESWESLTQIGALAGQLGIPQGQIVDFTRVVSQFAATTDVSVEDAATAFGRLDSLLADVDGNFEGVADSILNVGVNSVATETQIVRIATQISALGTSAGFSYQEIIGLSGALASVAVPPELARGVITRVFGKISRAISDGGVALERFGTISGMSGEQFKASWTKDAGGTFLKFMNGIKEDGASAEASIRALGITSVRDVPILIRLANAADSAGVAGGLMAQTFKDAALAAGTLDDQYAIVSGTINAKIQMLNNSFGALMETLGSGSVGPLGAVLDALIGKLSDLQKLANNDVAAWIVGIATALLGIGAALSLVVALGATALAGYAALIGALRGLQASAAGATLTMGTLNGMLAATGPVGAKAAAGISLVGKALKVLTLVGAALVLPDVAQWAADMTYKIKGLDTGVTDKVDRVTEAFKKNALALNSGGHSLSRIDDLDAAMAAVKRWGAGFEDGGVRDIKEIDEALAALVTSGNAEEAKVQFDALKDAYLRGGGNLAAFNNLFTDTNTALNDAKGAEVASGQMAELTEEEEAAEQATQDLLDTFQTADMAFAGLGPALETYNGQLEAMAKATADSTESADDSWEDYIADQKFNLQDYMAVLQAQIDAQTAWEDNMTALAGQVSEETLAELAKLGPEGAPLVAELVNASGEELARFDDLFRQASSDSAVAFAVELQNKKTIVTNATKNLGAESSQKFLDAMKAGEPMEKVLKDFQLDANGNPIKVNSDLAPAYDSFGGWLNYVNSQRPTIPIHFYATYSDGAEQAIRNPASYNLNRGGFTGGKFDTGGYTGDGGKYMPAGIVHKGEFVFTKESTAALGTGFLYNLMRTGRKGYAEGGPVQNTSNMGSAASYSRAARGSGGTQMVELSAYDRYLINKLGEITLMLGNQQVAKATNNAIISSSARGAY